MWRLKHIKPQFFLLLCVGVKLDLSHWRKNIDWTFMKMSCFVVSWVLRKADISHWTLKEGTFIPDDRNKSNFRALIFLLNPRWLTVSTITVLITVRTPLLRDILDITNTSWPRHRGGIFRIYSAYYGCLAFTSECSSGFSQATRIMS
jgi:hypothetical protein